MFGTIPVAVEGSSRPLDVMAAWTESRDAITVGVVNPTEEMLPLEMTFSGAAPTGTGTCWIITGAGPLACNVPGKAPEVTIQESQVTALGNKVEIPPLSICLYRLNAKTAVAYRSPSSFGDLPAEVVKALEARSCMIPQVDEITLKGPHNVISGEFLRTGQSDWAVLASSEGTCEILVFPEGKADRIIELAPFEEESYTQRVASGKMGFSRRIGAVGEDFIREQHKAHGGPEPPTVIDHQGIDDYFVGKASVVHYFDGENWLKLQGAD